MLMNSVSAYMRVTKLSRVLNHVFQCFENLDLGLVSKSAPTISVFFLLFVSYDFVRSHHILLLIDRYSFVEVGSYFCSFLV